MTKLIEWLSVFIALLTVWVNLYIYQKDIPYIKERPSIILYSPFVLIISFGLYSLAVIMYRVITFNNCDSAAKELQKEIEEARTDLKRLGFKFKVKN